MVPRHQALQRVTGVDHAGRCKANPGRLSQHGIPLPVHGHGAMSVQQAAARATASAGAAGVQLVLRLLGCNPNYPVDGATTGTTIAHQQPWAVLSLPCHKVQHDKCNTTSATQQTASGHCSWYLYSRHIATAAAQYYSNVPTATGAAASAHSSDHMHYQIQPSAPPHY